MNTLPCELKTNILSYLYLSDILSTSLVSKNWFQAASSDQLWKPIYHRLLNRQPRKIPWKCPPSWEEANHRYDIVIWSTWNTLEYQQKTLKLDKEFSAEFKLYQQNLDKGDRTVEGNFREASDSKTNVGGILNTNVGNPNQFVKTEK